MEWGMNSIRLVFTWEGVEPLQGQYDEDYLDKIETLLDGCAARRILVLLDAHQDLYARNFCGDGFPQWAVHPDYRDSGRGDMLLGFVETRATRYGISKLVVLTTRTAHWFRERGFQPGDRSDLPARRKSLYNYQRNSKVFYKLLSSADADHTT